MHMARRRARRSKKRPGVNRTESVSRRDLLFGLAATLASAVVPTASLASTQRSAFPRVLTNTERETLEQWFRELFPLIRMGLARCNQAARGTSSLLWPGHTER